MIAFFTDEADIIAIGSDFLRLISFNFIAQGIVFTASGAFQGMGNTRPALMSSGARLLVFVPIAVYLKYQPGFTITQVWYVSILAVTVQAVVSFLLVRKEFALKLGKPGADAAAPELTTPEEA